MTEYDTDVAALLAWTMEQARVEKADHPMVKWYAIDLKWDGIYQTRLIALRAHYGRAAR